ncbi:MAG: hypothetical protein QFX35_07550 [Candidatus Verstraetearchaeota archaeon]|nr:hypothetical protein [Candidatus Verstraetearchaeota archaeon]
MSLTRRISFDKIYEYNEKGALGKEIFTSFFERIPLLEKALRETEEVSGIGYPPVLFEPALTIIRYPASTFASAVIYAATKIEEYEEELQPCVVFSVPFVLFARQETLRAAAAHEFLHYVYITVKLSRGNYMDLAGERLDSIEVHQAYDDTHVVPPEEWFGRSELVTLIKEVFNPTVRDPDLERALKERWIERGFPVRYASSEEVKIKLPITEVARIRLDGRIVEKAKKLD